MLRGISEEPRCGCSTCLERDSISSGIIVVIVLLIVFIAVDGVVGARRPGARYGKDGGLPHVGLDERYTRLARAAQEDGDAAPQLCPRTGHALQVP